MPVVDVRQLGAAGDGLSDDAPVLQRALDGESRHIIVPPGVYRIGATLRIGSRTRLQVHPQARLVLADGFGVDSRCFLLTNRDHEGGDEHIEITGGIWDGNSAGNPRVAALVQPGAYTGVLLNFRNVRRLVFGHAMLCNAQTYYLRLSVVSRFLVEHLRFHTTRPRPNNDGVHLGGCCQDGVIRHLRGLGPSAPNDDMVALNADDALERVEVQGTVCGPIRDIIVHDLAAEDCHTFVRMLSVRSPISDVLVERVRGGCEVSAVNMDGARGCRVQLFDPADPRLVDGVGDVSDVRISDLCVHKTRRNPAPLLNLQQRVHRLLISGFVRDIALDADPSAPTVLAQHLPGHWLSLEGLRPEEAASLGGETTSRDAHGRVCTRVALGPQTCVRLPCDRVERLVLGSR